MSTLNKQLRINSPEAPFSMGGVVLWPGYCYPKKPIPEFRSGNGGFIRVVFSRQQPSSGKIGQHMLGCAQEKGVHCVAEALTGGCDSGATKCLPVVLTDVGKGLCGKRSVAAVLIYSPVVCSLRRS